MPSFLSRFRSKEQPPASKQKQQPSSKTGPIVPPKRPRWEDAWTRKDVEAEEVQELLHICNQEMKSRALEVPFLLLPFRPDDDLSAARNFIRGFFKYEDDGGDQDQGSNPLQELRLLNPSTLCSIMKWCWGRLRGGVVTWGTYNLFKTGEMQSNMAPSAFDTFIPLSAESKARSKIIFDFFELLAAVAAHAKSNGLGGRKLSRLAGWWAFEFADTGKGFDGGYRLWENAANATSHLFFAYLRSRATVGATGNTSIYQLPRSLQALVAQTEYPPESPTLLLTNAPKVVMIVDKVSPTPFSLLRRARHFDFQANDPALLQFSEYGDPVEALTFECRRVLEAISSTNQSSRKMNNQDTLRIGHSDESWSRFQDIGFSSMLDGSQPNGSNRRFSGSEGLRSAPSSGKNAFDRPVTPSWADFMSSGFTDDSANKAPASLNLPSDQMLPPITPVRVHSSQSHVRNGMRDDDLDPGELASINRIDLDETFWWVWISSLAGEEPGARKAVFGRCAFIETDIHGGRWLVMEEQVKGAAVQPEEGAMIAQKKKRFTFGRRDRSQTPTQAKRTPGPRNDNLKRASATIDEVPSVNSEQQAKVQEAAAEIVRQQQDHQQQQQSPHDRRGRSDDNIDSKTASVMTLGLQPVLQKDAGPAMQWARKFDKESIRARYLGDTGAGRGFLRDPVPSQANTLDLLASAKATDVDLPRHGDSSRPQEHGERDLPAPPTQVEESGPTMQAAQPEVESQRAPSPLPPQTPPKDAPMYPPPEPPTQEGALGVPSSRGHQHKESERTLVSPNAHNHMSRKPVGSVDNTPMDHPALRQDNTPSTTAGPQTTSPPNEQRSTPSPDASRQQQQSQPPTTAAAAAAAAWKKPADPQADPAALRSKKGSTRGFKKFFGRNKKQDEPEPEALAMHRAISSAKLKKRPRGKSDVTRKQVAQPTFEEAAPSMGEGQGFDEGEPGPEIASEGQMRQQPSSSRREGFTETPTTREADERGASPHEPALREPMADEPSLNGHRTQNHSVTGFSDFSQGPLDDQPAYVGDDESIPPVPEKDDVSYDGRHSGYQQQGFQTQTAARLFGAQHEQASAGQPESHASGDSTPREHVTDHDDYPEQASQINDTAYATPMDAPGSFPHEASDMDDEDSPREGVYAPPTRSPPAAPEAAAEDRWAQIRKNAAERRGTTEEQNRSDDHQDWRQSQGARTEKTDDGETSGEETIESRVARIRARVAQLTGNPAATTTET